MLRKSQEKSERLMMGLFATINMYIENYSNQNMAQEWTSDRWTKRISDTESHTHTHDWFQINGERLVHLLENGEKIRCLTTHAFE